MFENVLGQNASDQLVLDVNSGILAPAMLFSGPVSSGKGTAALELGRIISCEDASASQQTGTGSWNCGCSACSRHRSLIHPDLICLGWKPFSAEIAASARSFTRDLESGSMEIGSQSQMLFIRSLRKLLARFNPVLWEDDPKGGKLFPLVNSIEEDLDELY